MAQEPQKEILTAQSQVVKDLAYLVSCAVNSRVPEKERIDAMDVDAVLKLASIHSLAAATAMALESAGYKTKATGTRIISAVRRAAFFEAEWETIKKKLDEAGIWYLPLKGVILKKLYPQFGMREMADHDILFDVSRQEDLRTIMEGLGYTTVEYGESNHDAYQKSPCLNFEMHTALFNELRNELAGVYTYFRNVENRLQGEGCEKQFSDEDFYLHLVAHEYKHYCTSGTGMRSLLDIYVFLKHKSLNWKYIDGEAERIGYADYEKVNRSLAFQLFGDEEMTSDGKDMLTYIVSSGTYGTQKHRVENRMQRKGGGKVHYIIERFKVPFSRKNEEYEAYAKQYPTFYRHKILLPVLPFYRIAGSIWKGRFMSELKSLKVAEVSDGKPMIEGKNVEKNTKTEKQQNS